MDLYGITWNQEFLLYICCFLLVLGGILVLIGYRSTFGAVLLLLYFVPVTYVVHDFWNVPRGTDNYRMESILFMKNLAIIGALMIIAAGSGTSGRYSIRRLFATTKVGRW
jgi:putative oxidoreductase